ncbi:MAG TPA: DUF3352 domain-containing protein [Blastocatellia bacterium]|nr:DUF3352 domain-containing protein [Blastocatellia bacterium]
MKSKTTSAVLALCLILVLAQSALPQAASNRPRTVAMADPNAALVSLRESPARAALESLVPRDGLQLYFEVRNGGLAQLAAMPTALAPMTRLLSTGRTGPAASELAGFAMRNLAALSSARIAFVSYGASGQALLIESANPQDGEKLKADLDRMLAAQDAAKSDLSVAMRDRVVMAGAKAAVNKVAASDAAFTLVEDREFNKAQAHFSTEPFFAYLEMGAMPIPWPAGGDSGQNAAYTAGMMAAFNNLPYAMAMGGSFEAGTARMRALLMYTPKQNGGLFSSLVSATRLAEPQAPGFAASNTDFFVDLMVDWEKLYEGLESIFAMVAGAQASGPAQSGGIPNGGISGGDLLQMMESQLGFSIKNDLLPTLGGEVAIAISGFDEILSPQPKQGKRRAAGPSFTLILALKDPVKFEKYFNRLFSRMGGQTSQPFARAPYRGTTINYNKSMAYAISGGFLVAGGSFAQIRRALDGKAAGTTLAASPEFNQAMGAPRPVMLQVYVSSGAANGFFKTISTQAAKMKTSSAVPVPASMSRSAIGVTMTPDADGLMLDVRVPAELAVLALAAMVAEKPNAYGINSQTGARPAGRRTPTLTDEDLKARRP